MKVGQLESRMPPYLLSFLLLLSLFCYVAPDSLEATNTIPLPSVYIPVGVGFKPDLNNLKADFGMFGNHFGGTVQDAFTTCGTKTLNSLNERFTANAFTEVIVYCEPSPDRVIIRADEKPYNFGTFDRNLKEECELFTCSSSTYEKRGDFLGTMDISVYFASKDVRSTLTPEVREVKNVTVVAGEPENAETNVCYDMKAGYSKGATGAILFANEAQCYQKHKERYEDKGYIQVPRWLQSGESVKNIRPFFFNGERSSAYDRTPYSFRAETKMDGLSYQKCDTTCDSGKVVKMTARNSKYKISIAIDTAVCTAFRICISPENFSSDTVVPKCNPGKIIDVNVKSGIVVWPNKGRSSLIELMSPLHEPVYPVVVEFGYGIQVNKKDQAEYYIGNDHREIVSSNSAGFNADDSLQLAFFFPAENCLKEKAGIFSKYVENAVALSSKTMTKGDLYTPALTPIVAPQHENVTTTTTIGPINLPHTTTLAAPRAIPDAAHLVDAESAFETNEKSSALYIEGKWWTWGIYIGFVIGTLITLGIGGGLFYVLRRTVFGIWYRGMYKRYGCDVSGTTGGITGVGFGNTVTGDVTVQGTSGGTTVGTTGTTTSGTTGGTTATETSTLLDKTSGSKSIAM